MQKRELYIDPFNYRMLQPATIDVQLGDHILEYARTGEFSTKLMEPLDPLVACTEEQLHKVSLADLTEPYRLQPHQFVLGCTLQRIKLGPTIAARVDGKSSLGRLGLEIHSTAGFIDPGFMGNITLEISNRNQRPILLREGMWIGQLSFFRLKKVERPYGSQGLNSHYQYQHGAHEAAPLGAWIR